MKFPRDPDAGPVLTALPRMGFAAMRRSGSHIRLRRGNRPAVGPDHRPIRVGTLRGAPRPPGVTLEEFQDNL
jgi:predicted RNA binding protein YcfA (HicA-like mRNA interferase family)